MLDADVIYRLNTRTGVVKTLAGSVKGCTNQDLSHLDGAQALSIDPKLGVIYIAETDSKKHNFVRSLPVNGGRLTTVAGIASKCDCDRVNCPCDDPLGKPPAIATQSFLHKPVSLIVDAHGRLYVADQANFKIKLVEHVSAFFDSSNRTYVINSPSTNEVFHFNQHGLHQMTTSLLSGQELYHFKYSVDTRFGMLSEVTAPGGFSMRLSRMNETDIILDGTMPHKTLVRMYTFDRQLVQMVQVLITNGKTVEFDYENGQLLKTRRSLDRTFFFEYDAAGRVTTMSTSTGETYSFDSDYSLNNVLNTDVHLNGQRFRRFIASNDDFSEEGSSSKLFTSLANSFIYENEEAKSTFDAVTHPLLRPHESAILKRKIVLPSTEEPMRREIRSRFEWRTAVHTDEGKNVIQVGRRPRINGRNAFTIEFDRQLARDIVRDAYDNDILTITYTPSGLIAKVEVLGALNLEPFSGTYDSHGLPLSYTWGELRQDFAYDAFQRLIANTFSRKGDLLVRRYTYGSDSSPNPSMVTMPSGNMFKWLYNSDGGVASLKSPSDEVIDFWGVRGIQNDAAAIYYRRSKAGQFNGVATATYNSNGDLMEFVNLNGNERVSVKRDVYGRIVRIQSGKYNTNIEYDKYGRVSKASTNSIKREYFYQGPLVVAMKRTSDKGGSAVYFSTEYDDLFRQTTIHINFNGTALEPLKLEYDHLTGHISKIGRCIFTSSNEGHLGCRWIHTFSGKGDLLVRRYTYGSDSSPNPSMVTMPSGNMFKWLYNSDGGVASLKSPSDEVIDFWGVRGIQNDAAAIYYRRSKAGHFNGVATATYNSKGDLMEFVNLNGNERVSVKRDVYERIVRIQNGKYNTNIEYDKYGRVSKASTNSIKREYFYQGPLVVAMKRTSDKGGNAVYFSTEYDDLFRQTTIHINFNGTALEPLKLEYDHLTGHISKIGRCIFTSSNGVQRISNDAFVYDSEYSTTRQLKKVTLVVGGLTMIQFQSVYDTVGRLESTIWTVQDETRPTETHAYAIDGGLSEYALSSRANKQIWHSYYDASGRLVKINDDTIDIGPGGIARRVGQLNYTTDNNGWTLRRGAFLFDYDALGQLRRATHTRSRGIDIVYEYDEKNRIIARRYLHSGRVQRFYYALANANDLVTHFTDSSVVDSVWTIHYNNEKTPYLLECSSGTSHIIVTDPTGSVRFVVNEQGSIDRELGYSPTGDAVFDTKMDLYFPLGYLGKFHDVETGIVFVTSHINGIPVTRPMDSKLGRYMSTSLNMVFNEMNAFRPEEITDPFMFEHNHKAVEIPATPNEWLLLAGTNVKNLIPFTKLDLDSENTCIKSAVVSGAICAAEDQLRFLSQVMTMQPTKFIGLTSSHRAGSRHFEKG